jgi:protoporphyrinogen oxidase
MVKLAVIGAGPMGLAAAYYALRAGHQVEVFEADDRAGGMAAHFDFDGLSIERYYHFVCKSDTPTFELLAELGIAGAMRWRATSMGYFIDGRHYRWGDPWSLLRFPLLGPIDKFRYGLQMFMATRARNFDRIESRNAADWIVSGAGQRAYDVLWRRLLQLKFHEYADSISASWIATRIRRVGRSRRSLMQEELGYLEGGSQALIDGLVAAIWKLGGRISLASPVREIMVEDGRVAAVRADLRREPVDAVISTVPTPYVAAIVPALSAAAQERYRAIRNIGVACVLLKLKRSVTPNFWLNVNDPDMEIPGIIEFSNLRPLPETVVYVPYYMPHTHPKWSWPDARLVAECMACLKRVNPAVDDGDLIASHVGRLRHAQPVCEPEFAKKLPAIQTEIAGLQIADTCFYYPEDRGIAESVRLAKTMVGNLR